MAWSLKWSLQSLWYHVNMHILGNCSRRERNSRGWSTSERDSGCQQNSLCFSWFRPIPKTVFNATVITATKPLPFSCSSTSEMLESPDSLFTSKIEASGGSSFAFLGIFFGAGLSSQLRHSKKSRASSEVSRLLKNQETKSYYRSMGITSPLYPHYLPII